MFKNKILTVPVIILIFTGIVSFAVWRLSARYVQVADFFTETISFILRFILTKTTYLIPFSITEFMLYASVPLILFLLARFIFKIICAKNKGKTKTAVFFKGIFRIIAFLGVAAFIFTFTWGVCYGKTPVNEKMAFERRLLGVEDLSSAMEILITEANKIITKTEFEYSDAGSTIMPYNLSVMNKKLNEAYKNLLGEYALFTRISARVKPVLASEIMSKMHIAGIYTLLEANINIDGPTYNLPYSSAHEISHLMGVAREDEANFVAFLVCLYSVDDYIKYSGVVNMIEYIGNALYRADKDKYQEIMKDMPFIVRQEIAAYSRFFDKYKDTQISKVASAANDTYLKAQGQEHGEKSYGFVVDLATVYLLDIYIYNRFVKI